MKNSKLVHFIKSVNNSHNFNNILLFTFFAIILTFILASKYIIFQNLINKDGLSKREIVANKTIEVVDTFKTEQLRKEVAQKVEPVLVPAEDNYIMGNLVSLINNIRLIRDNKNLTESEKRNKINVLLDLSENTNKNYVINFFISSSDEMFLDMTNSSKTILDSILKEGLSEKVFEGNNINKIIFKHSQQNYSKGQIRIVNALIEQVIRPNMIVDELATEIAKKNAANSVNPYIVKFERGDKIVYQGEPVTKVKRDALRKAGYNVLELNFVGLSGIFIYVVLSIFIFLYYLYTFDKKFTKRSYFSIIGILVIFLTAIGTIIPDSYSFYYLPVPAVTLLLAIFTNGRVAMFISILLIMGLGITLQLPSENLVVFTVVSLISAVTISKIKYSRRVDLIKSGFEIAVCMIVIVSIINLIERCIVDISPTVLINDLIACLVTGISSGILVLGSIPMFESLFKVITPFGLSELADHNQPLLKRLQFEAPGTFAHSLAMSNMAESVAEAIDADPVLTRVGALYHDIGKLKRPLFFIENQTYFGIDNPHNKLNPRLSKMVIMAHPRDGLELAKEYNLPPQIQDFIIQHHGETLAAYFYNEAIKEEGAENVSKDQFRYSGPKPNSKETAIVMIADAVESASRTLKDYTVEEINTLIQKIINDRLTDGQLSDSPLTLKDLKTISSTLNRLLRAAHHKRIKYHEDIINELEKKGNTTFKLPEFKEENIEGNKND